MFWSLVWSLLTPCALVEGLIIAILLAMGERKWAAFLSAVIVVLWGSAIILPILLIKAV